MILSKRVALNGEQLDEIHERIVIRSVDTSVPHEDVQAVSRMGGWGQRLTVNHWETLEVTVNWAMDVPKKEMALRREIYEAVTAWALQKGWLTVNFMPKRRMRVDKVVVPSSGDLWQWTSEFPITFRAYAVPFWQDTDVTETVVRQITNDTVHMDIPGIADTVLNVSFQNISGAVNDEFSIRAGSSLIDLKGISLGGTETLTISHGTDDLLKIKAGTRSVYSKLQPGSSDMLRVSPGNAVIEIASKRAGKLTLSCNGRYL